MSKQTLIAKNILTHLHQSNLILISDCTKDVVRIIDFIFENDLDNTLLWALEMHHSIHMRTLITDLAERAVRYNSIKCVHALYRSYFGDESMIERLTRALIFQACDFNNIYMIHLALASIIARGLDMSDTIEAIAYNSNNSNKYDIIGHIISTCKRYNVDISPISFEWEFLCKVYDYNSDVASLCISLQYDRKVDIDDVTLPSNDTTATTFVRLIFAKLKVSQVDVINLMEHAISKGFMTCAAFLFTQLDDENKSNMVTNAITKDKVDTLRFLHGAMGIGPLHAYLCDLCVIHAAIKCLRYLVERVGLRPTQTTYNLCMRDQRSRWYGDYIKAYLQ